MNQLLRPQCKWKIFSIILLILCIGLELTIQISAAASSSSTKPTQKEATGGGGAGGGKNVLFFVGFCTYSHRISMWPLVQKMADEGYNITFLSSHPPKSLADPRVHEYIPQSFVEMNRQLLSIDLLDMRLQGFPTARAMWDAFPSVAIEMYQNMVKEKVFLEWFESSKFDLIFMDSLYCDFALGLAYKFKAQVIMFSTTVPYMWQSDGQGAPVESWIPDLQFAFPQKMSFLQRVVNVFKPIYWTLLRQWSYFPALEKLFRSDLGLVDMPSLEELEKNVSLTLTNTHFSEEFARSAPPNLVSIGGLHCGQAKPNEDLKELGKFMDQSGPTGGFMFVSLGSAAKVSNLPPHLRQIFFTAMRNAKTNFVLKWEGDRPKDLPKNVFLADWFPQQNVLGHRNIKGFITHGGLLGVQEAVCSSVPMIFFPIFGEQDYNGNRFDERGSGIKLDFGSVTLEKLESAISKLLFDPSFKQNMERTSKLFLDRQNTPLETASWWVNYVLRHGHVDALHPLGIHQTWYQRRLLDVWFFLLAVIVTSSLIFFKIISCVCCRCQRKRGSQKNEGKSQEERTKKEEKKKRR